ncbi:MAG: YicC/YloC family endoribonuclease, partial [Bacteroidota bacterium]
MTGYGRALGSFGDKTILVEVRTLNSKVTDIKLKLPGDYREKEVELRKIITDHAERGKIDLIIDVQNADGGANVSLNESLIRGYHRELSRISADLGLPQQDILTAILRIPNVIASPISEMDEQEWVAVCGVLNQALDQLKKFRKEEGAMMEADLQSHINNILSLLGEVTPFEVERMTRVRERLRTNIEEVI